MAVAAAAGAVALWAGAASALDKITVAYFLEWPTANPGRATREDL